MGETRGNLLPVYIVADESYSMLAYSQELNNGLLSLYETLRSEPMVAAKVRLSVLGFSDSVIERMALADVRSERKLPELVIRTGTNYDAVFKDLLRRIPGDIGTLKANGYMVHRPAVFFLSDGQPNNSNWQRSHSKLVDRNATVGAPNIIACGVGGDVKPDSILQVATHRDFAFVSIPGSDIGRAISQFFISLTSSVIQSGRSLRAERPELVVEKPEGFRMAIDVL